MSAERCECGEVGVHPYPIGGGWAMVCEECKRSSLTEGAEELEGVTLEQWEAWRVAAFGR